MQTLFRVTIPNVMSSFTICIFLSLTNGFKLFDQNLALTGDCRIPECMTERGILERLHIVAKADEFGIGNQTELAHRQPDTKCDVFRACLYDKISSYMKIRHGGDTMKSKKNANTNSLQKATRRWGAGNWSPNS